MDNQKKQMISTLIIEAMEREDLNGRGAAKCLNINPAYISMIKNPKSWDSIGTAAWNRFEAWADTRLPLKAFVLPDGEAVLEIFSVLVDKPSVESVKKPKQEKEIPAEKPAAVEPVIYEKKEGKKIQPNRDPSVETKQIIEAAATLIWGKIEGKLQEELNKIRALAPTTELTVPEVTRQSFALDIEINLVLNGQRLKIA